MKEKSKSFLFYRFSRKLVEYFFKIFYRIKVYGEKEHFIKGPAIIAGNHVSFYDPPFVGVAWPEVIHYFARPTLFKGLILGFLLRSFNVHPLPQESPTSAIKYIASLLKDGLKVVIFPEGTRSQKDKIIDPKMGFVMIASKSQSPIIPVYVDGAFDIWGRRHKMPKLFGKKMACIFGTPLTWDAYKELSNKEAKNAMLNAWLKSMADLRSWYKDGACGSPP